MSSDLGIEHGIQLPDGAFSNTAVPMDAINEMYPEWATEQPVVYQSVTTIGSEISITGLNTSLRFEAMEDGRVAILGNTVPRLCMCAGVCAMSGTGMSINRMAELNCARANTATALESVEVAPEGRFMLTAVGSDVFMADDSKITREMNGDDLMFKKLANAPAVVFTRSWLEAQGLKEISFGINGADGSFGLASMEIRGELVLIPFCSMRDNMGDRGEDKQILRKAINVYLDTLDISDEERAEIIRGLNVFIDISASATLRNFAHKIKIPDLNSEDPKERAAAAKIKGDYAELVERAGGITSAIVLESEYPGAFGRGSIFPQFEAEMGIHESPITPDSCPGDGQTCHIDYRTETAYALTTQLQAMGIPPANIYYDDGEALDPSAPNNNMASNRREQNNGVEISMTNRTINGMKVRLYDPSSITVIIATNQSAA